MFEMSSSETMLIVGAIIAVLVVVTTFASKLINAGKDNLSAKTDNIVLQTIIESVAGNTINVIKALNQTLVDELKAKTEDGKLSQEDIISIKNSALNALLSSLSDEAKSTLQSVFGDLNLYLSNLIESKLDDLKKGKIQ